MSLAKRYNKGKNRLELIPVKPLELLGDVYTRGAHKYSVYKDPVTGNEVLGKDIPLEQVHKYELISSGADNWRLGLSWSENIGSVKRHIAAYERGEDYDELGTYHLGNAAWGLITGLEMYHTHPELDDRNHKYLQSKKVGLDIDGVLADFISHLMEVNGTPNHVPEHWNDPIVREAFTKFKADPQFWLDIKPLLKHTDIPFEVHCYITARSIPVGITQQWLNTYLFPHAPIYSIGIGESKIEVAKKSGVELFIDDNYDNFVQLNKAGICTFLYDAPYNKKYDVGYKRVKNFADFKERFL